MSYFSEFYKIDVRESIAKEFTDSKGEIDDMMAGLHEIRVRLAEKEFNLEELEKKLKERKRGLNKYLTFASLWEMCSHYNRVRMYFVIPNFSWSLYT